MKAANKITIVPKYKKGDTVYVISTVDSTVRKGTIHNWEEASVCDWANSTRIYYTVYAPLRVRGGIAGGGRFEERSIYATQAAAERALDDMLLEKAKTALELLVGTPRRRSLAFNPKLKDISSEEIRALWRDVYNINSQAKKALKVAVRLIVTRDDEKHG